VLAGQAHLEQLLPEPMEATLHFQLLRQPAAAGVVHTTQRLPQQVRMVDQVVVVKLLIVEQVQQAPETLQAHRQAKGTTVALVKTLVALGLRAVAVEQMPLVAQLLAQMQGLVVLVQHQQSQAHRLLMLEAGAQPLIILLGLPVLAAVAEVALGPFLVALLAVAVQLLAVVERQTQAEAVAAARSSQDLPAVAAPVS